MEKVCVRINAMNQLILLPVQLANGRHRLGEPIESENGVMTYVYFKGNIVPVVGK